MNQSDSKIIIALDFAELNEALKLVEKLNPTQCHLKVGKEMFTRFGPDFVKRLIQLGFSVFLDLKFHDIPKQVAGACLSAADLGVWMITVHVLGGRKMLMAAREAIDRCKGPKPLLIGVTLLTSMDEKDKEELGLEGSVQTVVNRLAGLAIESKLDGVVCSPQEIKGLRKLYGNNFYIVTPGIRLASQSSNDQSRVMTPKEAITAGADYLVIGRPITTSDRPFEVLEEIQAEISQTRN